MKIISLTITIISPILTITVINYNFINNTILLTIKSYFISLNLFFVALIILLALKSFED
ncbi:hypothetical protein MARBORIA2_00080 [Methanobrevibacter arboriphilus]|jgi:hypothetical protein|uniref:Uncharacterized protein n=1 Tax=Methanobrevibacter arboriphilus TaxID=39441 RepID=A0ACA8R2R5_METAZ|nr:hypothetical protein MarbSA_08460 [Methanobrevibacter arboriphilus]GLI10918.1 hypothetical protein MARBORIA2_00080 [Methanobrevibacter arboriphilus]